jgi:sirohydrochlorin ferrochelatase
MERGIDPRLQALMTRLADGDRSALHPAFEILWPVLRRFTGRHLAPAEAALARDLETTLATALGALRPEDAETLRLYARGARPAIAAATFRKRVERALARLRTAWRTTDEHP